MCRLDHSRDCPSLLCDTKRTESKYRIHVLVSFEVSSLSTLAGLPDLQLADSFLGFTVPILFMLM